MDYTTKILDGLKLPTKTLGAVCVTAGVLIFSPESMLRRLGLAELVESYRPYLGIVFVLTLSIVLVHGLASVLSFFKPWLVQVYRVRQGKKRLKNLTPEEKKILSYYIQNQTRSQQLDVMSGTVNGLQRELIIIRGSNWGTFSSFDFLIQPWAWEYLNKNPHLLE